MPTHRRRRCRPMLATVATARLPLEPVLVLVLVLVLAQELFVRTCPGPAERDLLRPGCQQVACRHGLAILMPFAWGSVGAPVT